MSEDKGNDLQQVPKHDYISHFEGQFNPLNLKSVQELGIPGGQVELAVSPTGEKYVVKSGRMSPELNKELSVSNFLNRELQLIKEFGINPVDHMVVAMNDPYGEPSLKIITNYVEGDDVDVAPWELRRTVTKGLLDYFKEKINSEDDFLSDIVKPYQYIYGSVKGGEKKDLFS